MIFLELILQLARKEDMFEHNWKFPGFKTQWLSFMQEKWRWYFGFGHFFCHIAAKL